ncbi:hypothetical protein KCU79_g21127, partial [Aureobasidium melanogenum]
MLGRVNRAKGYTYKKRKKKKKQTDSVISSAGDCGTDGKDVNNNDDAAAAAVLTAPAAATAVLAIPSLSSSPVTSAPTETRRNTSPADDQSLETSVRLYKKAATISKENDVILPTDRAKAANRTALCKNFLLLKE